MQRQPALRTFMTIAFLGAALGTASTGCQGKGSVEGAEATGAGMTPVFTGKSIDGEYIALEDFRGKVVLLNVWATWCGPCRMELPELRRLHHRYADQGFTVLGVSVDKERDFNKVKGVAREFRLDYPIIFDPASTSVGTFDVKGYPTTLLLDRTGTVRWRQDGLIQPDDEATIAHIEAALSAPAVP